MPAPTRIVLVEDDVVDVEAVQRAFRSHDLENPIDVFHDGVEALEGLRGEGGIGRAGEPFVVFLDLNMPRMNGLEFLRALRADADLADTPVFVLTTSNDEIDRAAVEALGIDGYVVKARLRSQLTALVESAEAAAQRARRASPGADGEKPLLLVVDDDEVDRERVSRQAPANYRVVGVADGAAGVAVVAQECPACVLLDYRLPGGDGLDVLARILEVCPDQPVVMLTGAGSEAVAAEALKRGAQDYLIKGQLNPHVLERAVENARAKAHLRRTLRRQQEEFRTFAHSAAHDLRAPLRRLQAWTRMLEEESAERLGPEGRSTLERMGAAVGQLGELIEGLLAYARAGKGAAQAERVELAAVVAQAVENLEVPIREKGAVVEVGALPDVFGEPAPLVVLFQNLLANALKFHDGTPHVSVDAELHEEAVVVRVTDDGIGVDPATQARMFEPFVRGHEKSRYEGSGLGLATCRRVVEAHGGTIRVESRPGTGTTFFVQLPAARPNLALACSMGKAVSRAAE